MVRIPELLLLLLLFASLGAAVLIVIVMLMVLVVAVVVVAIVYIYIVFVVTVMINVLFSFFLIGRCASYWYTVQIHHSFIDQISDNFEYWPFIPIVQASLIRCGDHIPRAIPHLPLSKDKHVIIIIVIMIMILIWTEIVGQSYGLQVR